MGHKHAILQAIQHDLQLCKSSLNMRVGDRLCITCPYLNEMEYSLHKILTHVHPRASYTDCGGEEDCHNTGKW